MELPSVSRGAAPTAWAQLWTPSTFRWVDETPFSALWVPCAAIVAYLVVIFGLQAWMAKREAYKLTNVVVAHNGVLLVWAVSMCGGCVYYGGRRIARRGLFTAVFCETDEREYGSTLVWVTYWFYLSKFWELLDSVIIVLKKRPLIFLHWYHHWTALILSWYNLESVWPQFWVCVLFNALVHTFMYYYYAERALGHDKWWKRYLTQLQLMQFMLFVSATSVNVVLKTAYAHYGCLGSLSAPVLNALWIVTLIVLFGKFYMDTYKNKKQARAADKRGKQQ
mmetsp:Transcript_33787/g.82863  ORF Transcript_33787/g.82863 Transcript_33787/m.82863 type:complete len:279 (-) Transcript_33787:266-1102(-)